MFCCRQSSDKVLVLGAPAMEAEDTATKAYADAEAASAEEQAQMVGGNF